MVVSYVALSSDRLLFSASTDHADPAQHLASLNYAGTQNQLVLRGYQGADTARLSGIASPEEPTDAISAGYTTWKTAVRFASNAPLEATMVSENTLRATGVGALVLAGGSPALGDRVLVKNQVDEVHNGIYVVTVLGTEVIRYDLTRAPDFRVGCNILGAAVVVREGTYEFQMFFAYADGATVEVGTDPIYFSPIAVDVSTAPIGGGQISVLSIGLEKLSAVETDAGGQLVYFISNGEEDDDGTAQRLPLGILGYPLVAGATNPQYAQLTNAGIAEGTITGDKLEAGIYRDQLTIGNSEADEYISFGAVDEGEGVLPKVQVYVGDELRLSATTAGGSFIGTWSGSSDEKWKDLLGPVTTDALADLDKVQSESWTWKPGFHFQAGTFGAGVTAQQFQQVCPRAVTYSAEQGGLVVDYNAVQSFQIACLKALNEENRARKAEVADLKQANAALSEANAALSEANAALAAANAALETRVGAMETAHRNLDVTVACLESRIDSL
jgi:hypothetical protein